MDNKTENQNTNNENKDATVKPEPETLHKTDPQKNMEGPISSLMHKVGKGLENDQTKEEADEKKEKNM
ncbi:MAG: hypothetical protein ABIO04_12485 [Ferruginibacter sp.]